MDQPLGALMLAARLDYAGRMSDFRARDVALVIFCRRPAPGAGKQRLAAEIGPVAAAELATCLLATALEDAVEWPGPVVISPADPCDLDWAATILGRPALIIAQPPGNLGERLNAVDAAARAAGHARLLFIGSDAPGLDAGYFAEARAALGEFDVVIGPASDGGVTAMGARVPWPRLERLAWSTPRLHADLVACCRNAGLGVRELATRRDVDVAADLAAVRGDCLNDTRPARQALLRWLDESALADAAAARG
jgi:rSAM/selenodomain-associated transferase 1